MLWDRIIFGLSVLELSYAIWIIIELYLTEEFYSDCLSVWKFDAFGAGVAIFTAILGFFINYTSKNKWTISFPLLLLSIVIVIWGTILQIKLSKDKECSHVYDSVHNLLIMALINLVQAILGCITFFYLILYNICHQKINAEENLDHLYSPQKDLV